MYEVTEQLLLRGIALRDVKPENVMISREGEVILMDLGVIKPIGAPSFSDAEQKQFVGTLRYAPPEFLLRAEEDKPAAWKTINFYQIGAVLHDLVMKKEIFHDANPFSRLVLAIKEDVPIVSTVEYPYETIQLIRDLLTKDPFKRLELVPDSRLRTWLTKPEDDQNELEQQLEATLKMTSHHKPEVVAIENIRRSTAEKKQIREKIGSDLEAVVDICITRLQGSGLFRSFQKAPPFKFHSDEQFLDDYYIGNYLFEIKGELQDGFSAPLYLLIKVENDELSNSVIDLLGVLITAGERPHVGDPLNIFRKLNWDRQTGSILNRIYNPNSLVTFNLPAYRAFRGTIGFDQQFENKLMLDILKIIKKAIELMADDTAKELKWLRDNAAKINKVTGRRPDPGQTLLIHEVN